MNFVNTNIMKLLLIISFVLLYSCKYDLPVPFQKNVDIKGITEITTYISKDIRDKMEGVYKVETGSEILGKELVAKWIDDRFCLYSSSDVIFSVNTGGLCHFGSYKGSIIFAGYIYMVRNGSGHHVEFSVDSMTSSKIINGELCFDIQIRGKIDNKESIIFKKIRELYNSNYYIIAHRGGGRNSERLGVSENSLEMIKYSESMGATGVEIDVQSTRDGIPIIFHDETFSPRTIQGIYLLGKVSNFDLSHIKAFGQLINGEDIPTLEEALKFFVDSTYLSLLWLDIKDVRLMDRVIEEHLKAIKYAESINR